MKKKADDMTLFETQGPSNTDAALRLALDAARERSIGVIVVASHSGETARRLLALNPSGLHVVCVTAAAEYGGKQNPRRIPAELHDELRAAGVDIVEAAHALSGAERGLSSAFGGAYPLEIMAHTLRMFCAGVKVCVESSVMAVDAGRVRAGHRILAVGGSQMGADTAAVVRPAPASRILDARVEELICKPR